MLHFIQCTKQLVLVHGIACADFGSFNKNVKDAIPHTQYASMDMFIEHFSTSFQEELNFKNFSSKIKLFSQKKKRMFVFQ